MIILLFIYKYFLKFLYFFIKLFRTKNNRILFLSRQSNDMSIDFKYIIDEIKKRNLGFEIIVLSKRMDRKNIKDVISYIFHPIKQMYYLATSKLCIIDGYQMSVSILKHKKKLKVIQIWHSLGAIKKFGYASLNSKKEKIIAKLMCMHKNYDYIISPSLEMSKLFADCFGYNLDSFVNIGTPKIDYLINNKIDNQNKIYNKYPELKRKKIALYVPTYRKNNYYNFDEIQKYFKDKNYELIIKKHPNINIDIYDQYKDISSTEFLSIADIVITDYSAILLDSIILNKKTYLFTYDYDDYKKDEGLNINLNKEFKPYVFKKINDLDKYISLDYNFDSIEKFKNKYVSVDKDVTSSLVDFIEEVINDK